MIKGLLGLGAGLVFVGYVDHVDHVDGAELLALAGLSAPLGLAALSRVRIRLRFLEAAGVALFAAVVSLVCVLTGGLASPFLSWMMLVPFEGALAGRWFNITNAGAVAFLGLASTAAFQLTGMLPAPHFVMTSSFALVLVAAAAAGQATLLAIAAQKRKLTADKATAALDARYRFLAENAADLITSHSPEGGTTFASPSSNNLLGFTPEEFSRRPISAFTHPEDRKTLAASFEEASGHRRAVSTEIRLKRKDGSYVWAEFSCRPAGESHGGRRDVVAVTRNVTERKAHERALVEALHQAEEASRAKSNFLANMSHELRTPLNAIIGFSDVMTKEIFGPAGSPRYTEYAGLINESGNHLLELINTILDMSKIEAGRFEIFEEVFDLEQVVEKALRYVDLQAQRQGVRLETTISPTVQRIYADQRAVVQILINLLSNGVKFTPADGVLRVAAQVYGGGVEIVVSDNGIGISEETLQRLGKPFEQAEGALSRKKEGTGLGLALVHSLARLHGGSMKLESQLGKGTTVRIFLPKALSLPEDLALPEDLDLPKAMAMPADEKIAV